MATAATLQPKDSALHASAANDNLIPGTSFAEKKANTINVSTFNQEPQSFDGPQISGRSTTLVLLSPHQLAESPLLPALYTLINHAFRIGHEKSGHRISRERLSYDGQLNDELGNDPRTFTYVLCFSGTHDVIATASAKPHAANLAVVGGEERSMWKRYAPIAEGKVAWELSTMAVREDVQRQGLAGYLMKTTEDEVRRRFIASDISGKHLILVITTVKERNFSFYSNKGYTMDYEMFYDAGNIGAARSFHVVFMSKPVDI